MSVTLEQFGLDRLTAAEKLQLIDLLHDSIPEAADFVPPASHIDELRRRIAAAEANPTAAESWEAVYARLSRKA